MSWDTLVVGNFRIKEGVDEEEKKEILKDAKRTFECEIGWDEEWEEYSFEDVNWLSHVREEKIEEWIEKWKEKLERWNVSLYYLSEADERWSSGDEEEDENGE